MEEIVSHFRHLQESSGKKLYIWLTGGEPSLVTNFAQFTRLLTADMHIELQTNLCTKYIRDFAKSADPSRVVQVMASYHGEILDQNESLRKLYFDNFKILTEQGFAVVLKTIARPEEIPQLKDKVDWLRTQLPDNAMILIQPYIAGEVGPREYPNSYPYIYSEEEKRVLQEVVQIRRGEIFDYINGAGWFQGMRCDAGRGFIAMDKNGDVFRCIRDMRLRHNCLGNLVERSIQLLDAPMPCRAPHCNAPFWSLWYGFNPWDYIGKKAEDCGYCRFSPIHLGSNKASLAVVGREGPRIGSRYGMRRVCSDALKERKATAQCYLRWATLLMSVRRYRHAGRYTVKAFLLNPFDRSLLRFLESILLRPITKLQELLRK